MRQIALDTETTGLELANQHRLIEIGCVELISGRRSGKVFHRYVNPHRSVGTAAHHVHGISDDFLRRQPTFNQIVNDFLNFIKNDQLIIHNAEFDLGFINAELTRIQKPALNNDVIDTLLLAREKFPNQSNRLDALCQRFSIDLSARDKHGALVDAGLLAEVYIALAAGNQESLSLSSDSLQPSPTPQKTTQTTQTTQTAQTTQTTQQKTTLSKNLLPKKYSENRLSPQEIQSHQQFIQFLAAHGKTPLWYKFNGNQFPKEP